MNETFKDLYNFIDNHFNGLSKSLVQDGIKCEKCFDEPIRGYRLNVLYAMIIICVKNVKRKI